MIYNASMTCKGSPRLLSLLLESISKEGFCLGGPLAYCQCQSRRGVCSGRLLSLLLESISKDGFCLGGSLESISKEGFCLAGPLAYCQCQSRRGVLLGQLTARVNLQGGILFASLDGEFCSGRLLSLLLNSISKERFCLGRSHILLPVPILFTCVHDVPSVGDFNGYPIRTARATMVSGRRTLLSRTYSWPWVKQSVRRSTPTRSIV
ncbi:hypothetical protein J6590_075996 [Homalodisca vitripennis]|nr:hypothetical protein J6590_075996 [Homalodisca vitripennis]